MAVTGCRLYTGENDNLKWCECFLAPRQLTLPTAVINLPDILTQALSVTDLSPPVTDHKMANSFHLALNETETVSLYYSNTLPSCEITNSMRPPGTDQLGGHSDLATRPQCFPISHSWTMDTGMPSVAGYTGLNYDCPLTMPPIISVVDWRRWQEQR